MLKNYFLILLFFTLSSNISNAQNSIIISRIEGSLCAGTDVSVSYTTQGTFNIGNKFKVQYKNNSKNLWIDLKTEGTESPLKVTLPTIFDQPQSFSNFIFDFRIVSSNPVFEGRTYDYVYLKEFPKVEITAKEIEGVDIDEAVKVSNISSGYYPITLTMNDSSVVTLTNPSDISWVPEKSGEYFIAKVLNQCGVGSSSGKVNITINSVGIKIANIFPLSACANGIINAAYNVNGVFDKNNKFKIRLTNRNDSKVIYEFDATEKDGVVSAKIGNNVSPNYYSVSIIGTNPKFVSAKSLDGVIITSAPSAEVITENSSISFGQKKFMNVQFRGVGPFFAKLNDGTIVSQITFESGSFNADFEAKPTKTSQYFVESFTSGCGAGVGLMKTTVTVNQGIKTDSLPNKTTYCVGQTIKIPFNSNVKLDATSKFFVRFSSGNNEDYEPNYVDVDAKFVSEGIVECVLPKSTLEKNNYSLSFLKVFTSTIKGFYSPNLITFYDIPSASFGNLSTETYKSPQDVDIYVLTKGGGISNITLNDSLSFNLPTYSVYDTYNILSVKVNNTSLFKVSSVANSCGTTKINSNDRKTFAISNPISQNISLKKLSNPSYCGGNKVKVDFSSSGIFDNNNEFNIELVSQTNSMVTVLGKTKSNSIEVTLPTSNDAGNYKIRVVSSNPIVVSNSSNLFLQSVPTLTYSVTSLINGNFSPIIGEKYTESLSFSGGGIYEYETANGTIKKAGDGSQQNSNLYKNDVLKETDLFGVKSVKNNCGVGKVFVPNIFAKPVSYRLSLSYTGPILCQSPLTNVVVSRTGNPPANLSYSVQIAKINDTTFATLQTKLTSSIASFQIPSTYPSGTYKIRIVSEDGLSVKSNALFPNYLRLPSTTFTTIDGKNEGIVEGENQGTYLLFKNVEAGANDYTLSTDKNQRLSYSFLSFGNNASFYVNPKQTTVYTLKTVSNICGYGTGLGSVKVIVKPFIRGTFSSVKTSSLGTYCVGEEVNINLTTQGTFEKDNLFKISVFTDTLNKKEVFSTSVEGVFKVKLPSNIEAGVYQLEFKSTNPIIKKTLQYITINSVPEVVLTGGGAIINAGDRVGLIMNVNPSQKIFTNESILYKLSDSTSNILNSQGRNSVLTQPVNISKTFTLLSAQNACGVGKVSGSAKITVNPTSAKQINFDNYFSGGSYYCRGKEINVAFTTKGVFTANNKFVVQLSDSNGENYKDLVTMGNTTPLKAIIPLNTPLGLGYRLKVISTDNDATSTTNLYPFDIRNELTARFDTTVYNFEPNKPVSIKLRFVGDVPYTFVIGSDEITAKTFYATTNPYSLIVNPVSSVTYKLFSVSNNQCGTGTVLAQNTVTLQLITATEELKEMGINIFPNPTSDVLKIESDGKKMDLILCDMIGKIVLEKSSNSSSETLNLQNLATGQYLLKVQKNDKTAIFKVIKH